MNEHQCDRTAASATDPWTCPECGTMWEPLPATATAPAPTPISFTRNGAIIAVFLVAGVVLLGALAVSYTAFTVALGVGGLALVGVLAFNLIRNWDDF
ncbi:hypothetical protein GCM10022224_077110 [Nonomuraea antimicrobica]|uniref:Uncharacterized protein n=1 Tax=Nonomuraea antimicrobica TaxID=561173 RepID=A0ABP7D5M0_9ACTN